MSTAERLDVDYSERAGFLTGKSEAIQRWRVKKENAEFAALVNRLRVRKWVVAVKAEGGEKLARLREVKLRCYRKHREKYLARQRTKSRKAPREKACAQCGATFALPYPHPRGAVPKVCGAECRRLFRNAKARAHQATARSRKGHRVGGNVCGACGVAGHNRRSCMAGKAGS